MRRLAILVVALCVCLQVAKHANAAEQSVAKTIAEASKLFKASRHAEALQLFESVLEKVGKRKPTVQFAIARCHQELGRLNEAIKAYRVFLRMKAPSTARRKAKKAIRILEKKLSKGRLILKVTPLGADVSIDGSQAGKAPFQALDLKPGTHRVRIMAAGYDEEERTVKVPGGGAVTVTVALRKIPHSLPSRFPGSDQAKVEVSTLPVVAVGKEATEPSYSTWVWTALGVGAATVIGGSVALAMGEADHQEITSADGYGSGDIVDMTQSEARDLDESGDMKKLTGGILLGVGGAALATSLVLFLMEPAQSHEQTVSVSASLIPHGGVLQLQGRF